MTNEGDSILVYGWDADNEEWVPIAVDSSGQLIVVTE